MAERKTCTNCNKEKPITDFAKKYKTKNGTQKYSPICKKCVNKNDKRRDNKEYNEKKAEYTRDYYKKNRDILLEKKKEYHKKNREEILEKKKVYRDTPEYKEYIKEYQKEYREKYPDKVYKYRRDNPHIIAWRRNLYRTLSYLGKDKSNSTLIELGYSADELKQHLESLFVENMSWDNYGEWEIDHIKPLTAFDNTANIDEVNALSNLQPLWRSENRTKYNHIL